MIPVERKYEWMKQIITVKKAKQKLRINCSYGWNFQNYIYTLRNAPK
jgi:hypothetical protein